MLSLIPATVIMKDFLQNRGYVGVVGNPFVQLDRDKVATRVVGPLTKVTRLMSERVEMARDYETIGEKMARQKADDAAKGSGGAN